MADQMLFIDLYNTIFYLYNNFNDQSFIKSIGNGYSFLGIIRILLTVFYIDISFKYKL